MTLVQTEPKKIVIGQSLQISNYRYIRWIMTKNRADSPSTVSIQVSEFEICNSSGTKMSRPAGTSCTCNQSTVSGEGPAQLIDGNLNTKANTGASFSNPLIYTITLGSDVDFTTYYNYKRYTANDASERDPVSWTIEISSDGNTWYIVDSVSDANITTTRKTLAYTGEMTAPSKEVKKIMMRPNGVEKQIRPDIGWKPGANTIAYFPLESDTTDHSNNNIGVTLKGTAITYQTLSTGKKVAYFDVSSLYTNTNFTSTYLSSGVYTINYWFKVIKYAGLNKWQFFCGTSGTVLEVGNVTLGTNFGGKLCLCYGNNQNIGNTSYPETWLNVCITASSGTLTMYVNNSLYNSAPLTQRSASRFCIGGWWERSNDLMVGNISEFIIENKVRTAQEISDYYDQTKGNYGL